MDRIAQRMIDKVTALYNEGKWDKSIELLDQMRTIYNVDSQVIRHVNALNGWNLWKQSKRDEAAEYWQKALDILRAPDFVNSTVFSGLSLYMAYTDSVATVVKNYAMLSMAMIPDGEGTPGYTIRANACGIALAQLGDLNEAERVLEKTMRMNEEFESSENAEIAQIGKHQRAKNGYNLSALVLIPQGKYKEAREELFDRVIPRYQAVGATSDLAAALFRVGLTYEKEEHYLSALALYQKCLEKWKEAGDPARIEQAEGNVDRVRKLIKASVE